MYKFLFLILLSFGANQAHSQSYISAGGVRLGTGFGFTFQQKVQKHTTIEGILNSSFRKDQMQLTILGEQHFPLISKRFNMYMGAGLHKAWNLDGESTSVNPFGASFILGTEMTIAGLILSYDFKPAVHFQGDKTFEFQTGLSLRYVFYRKTVVEQLKDNHQERKKKRVKARKKRQKSKNNAKKKETKKKFNWRFWEDL